MNRRNYRLLCPIPRALDRIGDRWTLLILRDLHAGPARFSDLQAALPGLAPNLLTSRLRRLEEDGLVQRRDSEFKVGIYELTEMGRGTDALLFELAKYGTRFAPDSDIERPGNYRVIAVGLQVACQRVVDPALNLEAELVVEGDRFELSVREGQVAVRYKSADDPQVVVSIDYEAMVALADGRISEQDFAEHGMQVVSGEPAAVEALMDLMSRAMEYMKT